MSHQRNADMRDDMQTALELTRPANVNVDEQFAKRRQVARRCIKQALSG